MHTGKAGVAGKGQDTGARLASGVDPRQGGLDSWVCPRVEGLAVCLSRRYPGVGRGPGALPLTELLEDDAVGEALTADADALQHPIAAQLVQH